MRRNVISVINAGLDKESCILHAHKIANNISVLEGIYLANEAWNMVSKITIRNYCRLYINSKEVEAPVVIQI